MKSRQRLALKVVDMENKVEKLQESLMFACIVAVFLGIMIIWLGLITDDDIDIDDLGEFRCERYDLEYSHYSQVMQTANITIYCVEPESEDDYEQVEDGWVYKIE